MVWLQPRVPQHTGVHRSCYEAPGSCCRAPAIWHGHQSHAGRKAHRRKPAGGQRESGQASVLTQNHKLKSERADMNTLNSPVQAQVHPVRAEQSSLAPPEGATATQSSCGRCPGSCVNEELHYHRGVYVHSGLSQPAQRPAVDHIHNQSPYQIL